MRKLLLGAAGLTFAALALTASIAIANTAAGVPPQALNVKIAAIIDPTVSLTLDHNDTITPIDFGNVNPVVGTYTQTLGAIVKSNAGWTLKVFKVVGAGPCAGISDLANAGCTNVLASANLQWRVLPGAYAQITGTNLGAAQTVQTSAASTASTAISLDYQLTVGWGDVADTYSALHTYTLTQP